MEIICEYLILFMMYAVFGWVMEVIAAIYQYKEFVNRGFLIGPYCPIYGCGGIALTLVLRPVVNNPLLVFLGTVLICSILEYFTSYFMEKIFHARWWDYSQKFMNIKGRICLEMLIVFGILGLFGMYIFNPFLCSIIDKLPQFWLFFFAILFTLIFVVDFTLSYNIFGKIKTTIKKESKDNTREISKKVKAMISEKSLLFRRVVDAFPKFKTQLKFKKR